MNIIFQYKMNSKTINPYARKGGFTLVETVIAMGIIAIMITAFLAAFGPAVQGVRKSISAKEANRLVSSLEAELGMLRNNEHTDNGGNFDTAFEKAYEWIEESAQNNNDNYVLIYQYRGDPNSLRSDGTLEPYQGNNGVAGRDYVLQSVARRLGNTAVQEELVPGVVEGRVFYVKMTQLIFRNGVLGLTDEADATRIIDPTEPRASTNNAEDYPESVIVFQAEFYLLRNGIYTYVTNNFNLDDSNSDGHPDVTGRPVLVRNLAVRR